MLAAGSVAVREYHTHHTHCQTTADVYICLLIKIVCFTDNKTMNGLLLALMYFIMDIKTLWYNFFFVLNENAFWKFIYLLSKISFIPDLFTKIRFSQQKNPLQFIFFLVHLQSILHINRNIF